MGKEIRFSASSNTAEIILPGSKSQSNRYLVLQALSRSSTEIAGLSKANDTLVLQRLLKLVMDGGEGTLELDCEDGGAPLRFMMAVCALVPGNYLLTGTSRLMQRPQSDLVSALLEAGARIRALGENQTGPWEIVGGNLEKAEWSISVAKSSQYFSALVLIAPFLGKEITIRCVNTGGSLPYMAMTLQALADFGIQFSQNDQIVRVSPFTHSNTQLRVEADWSSAAFFLCAAAILKMDALHFPLLQLPSIQGDSFLETVFRYEGWVCEQSTSGVKCVNQGVEWTPKALSLNLSNYPDLAPALVVYYFMMSREVDFYGLESLAGKESVRDEVLGDMVIACGGSWEKGEGVWRLRGEITKKPGILNTHKDHRMVMAFALLSIRFEELELEELDSVTKSFPNFWEEIKKLGIKPE